MKFERSLRLPFFAVLALVMTMKPSVSSSCSTVMLEKGDALVFAHNLDDPNTKTPGAVFVNKRSVFKIARLADLLTKKEDKHPANTQWISRHGSVTFNTFFGRDLPDGGMNEEGLYVWEMTNLFGKNESGQASSKPKLICANWIQYLLDNFATVEQVVQNGLGFELQVNPWHYFIADKTGDCATIDFIDGKPVVHRKPQMPVTALFKMPYDAEVENWSYYKGFGGNTRVSLADRGSDMRAIHTAMMLRDYTPNMNAVEYGFEILAQLAVYGNTRWSIVVDAKKMEFFFKTDEGPNVKRFAMGDFDFSNATPVKMLDIDTRAEGDVSKKFIVFSDAENRKLVAHDVFKLAPLSQGLTEAECVRRLAGHYKIAADKENQFFKGVWRATVSGPYYTGDFTLVIGTNGDAVSGKISDAVNNMKDEPLDNIHMINRDLSFTYRAIPSKVIAKVFGTIDGKQLKGKLFVLGQPISDITFTKQ